MMRALGCLAVLAVLAVIALEVVAYWGAARLLGLAFGAPDYLLPAIAIVITSLIGVRVAKHHASRIPMTFLQNQAGRHVVGVVAGVLLAFPGLATDVLGALLLLPGVGRALNRLGNKVVAAVAARYLGRMMGGGAKGGLAGFPGMPGGFTFPGMKPDERIAKRPKTYDVKPEQ